MHLIHEPAQKKSTKSDNTKNKSQKKESTKKKETTKKKDSTKYSADNSLILYGSEGCGFCISLKKELDDAGISYKFFDVTTNESYSEEMFNKINEAFPGSNYANFPVVDINGKILIRPELDEVKKIFKINYLTCILQ